MNIRIDQQGAPMLNGHTAIHRSGKGIVALDIGMRSKHCIVGGTIGGDNDPPGVIIEAIEESLHLNESVPRDAMTVVSFPDYPNWRIWCAECSRYTLAVCLVDG